MRIVRVLLNVVVLCLLASSVEAVDGVVVVPLSVGTTRSIDYDDVVSLKKYVPPDQSLPLEGGTFGSYSSEYIVPANKMLVITTAHIILKNKPAATYDYSLYLYSETPPQPGLKRELWNFRLQDDGGGENREYHFSPGLIIQAGDMAVFENFIGSSDGATLRLNGYLVNK